jgi:hypothetical protein
MDSINNIDKLTQSLNNIYWITDSNRDDKYEKYFETLSMISSE